MVNQGRNMQHYWKEKFLQQSVAVFDGAFRLLIINLVKPTGYVTHQEV